MQAIRGQSLVRRSSLSAICLAIGLTALPPDAAAQSWKYADSDEGPSVASRPIAARSVGFAYNPEVEIAFSTDPEPEPPTPLPDDPQPSPAYEWRQLLGSQPAQDAWGFEENGVFYYTCVRPAINPAVFSQPNQPTQAQCTTGTCPPAMISTRKRLFGATRGTR